MSANTPDFVRIPNADVAAFFKDRFPVGTNLFAESMTSTLVMIMDGDQRGIDIHLRSIADGKAYFMHPGERAQLYNLDSHKVSPFAIAMLSGLAWYANTMEHAPLSEKQSRHLSHGFELLKAYAAQHLPGDEMAIVNAFAGLNGPNKIEA